MLKRSLAHLWRRRSCGGAYEVNDQERARMTMVGAETQTAAAKRGNRLAIHVECRGVKRNQRAAVGGRWASNEASSSCVPFDRTIQDQKDKKRRGRQKD
eukprot:scaffold7362_cov266-Pinguiococcus_pyrenoidosus.AAC.30